MKSVNIHEAKTHLSRLVEQVAAGESVVIAKAGRPVVQLVPLDARPTAPRDLIGFLSGRMVVPDDADRFHEDEIADLFEAE